MLCYIKYLYSIFLEMKLNLEYWISELPKPLTLIPVTELAIPGTYYFLIINIFILSKETENAILM